MPFALFPPPPPKTGSTWAEPEPREFKLWREEVGYASKYGIDYVSSEATVTVFNRPPPQIFFLGARFLI